MRKAVLLTSLAALFMINICRADTIDFYHVYYNDVQIEAYNQHNFKLPPTIMLKASDVKASDKLSVFYGSDTPCYDCYCYLAVTPHQQEKNVIYVREKGEGTRLNFLMQNIMDYITREKISSFDVWYFENDVSRKQMLFQLGVE